MANRISCTRNLPDRSAVWLCLAFFWAAAAVVRADWQLVWADEFNGSSVNTNFWCVDNAWGNCLNNNQELELYTNSPANLQETNGMLRLIGVAKNTRAGRVLTSARLTSYNIDECTGLIYSNQSYSVMKVGGAVEFRARIPQGTGLWPALWLLPSANHLVPPTPNAGLPFYGGWPNSGEIDVMENNGLSPNQVTQNAHFYNGDFQSSASVADVTQWHVYRCEWYTNQLTWMVDGVTNSVTSSWNPPPGYAYPAPFDAASGGFYVIMNLALGGTYTGNPSADTVAKYLPAEMDVDYVRVYRLGSPLLSASQSNSNITISWVQQPASWTLQQLGGNGSSWTPVPPSQYQTNQDQIIFSAPKPIGSNVFYRLIQQ